MSTTIEKLREFYKARWTMHGCPMYAHRFTVPIYQPPRVIFDDPGPVTETLASITFTTQPVSLTVAAVRANGLVISCIEIDRHGPVGLLPLTPKFIAEHDMPGSHPRIYGVNDQEPAL